MNTESEKAAEADDGGPAFPMLERLYDLDASRYYYALTGGMTLRDYFAIRCLPISRSTFPDGMDDGWDALAHHAYGLADAMLRARKEQS